MTQGASRPALDLEQLLTGRTLVVVGGTGFLGKVWWSLLLTRYPGVERLYMLVRRRGERSGSDRFWNEIVHSEALQPLRDQHGERFEEFLRQKIVPVEGDIVQPLCGVSGALCAQLQGTVAALVNASGVVDFQPPLDVGLEVNAFGVQNLVALARALGDCPLLHTSTCFVAGGRTGIVEEEDPRLHPFPRAGELERAHWDPDREIAECLSIIEQAKQRADDAFRQSHFLYQARSNLLARHEPTTGEVLEREVSRVRRQYVEARLSEMGNERARFWGWSNTYTYTKSIGEQIAVRSGLPVTIVRPAIIESSRHFPQVGWNEGINTSAPIIYAIREGQTQVPGSSHNLDLIPCDMVASGMLLALGELLEGSAPLVYQLGASDCNPVTMARIFELTGLYKRRYQLQRAAEHGRLRVLQAHVEGALLSSHAFEKYGPPALARGAQALSSVLHRASAEPLLAPLSEPAADQLERIAKSQERIGKLLSQFAPFTADYDYTFRCDNARRAMARLTAADRERVDWSPERIDWRQWFLEVHVPGLERWVFPEIDRRRARPPRPLQRHETLTAMLEELARRHDLRVALQHPEQGALARTSFRELRAGALACAVRLAEHGVQPGHNVLLAAGNDAAWVMAFFGVLYAGATLVPVAPETADGELAQIVRDAQVVCCIGGVGAQKRDPMLTGLPWYDVQALTQPGPLPVWARQASLSHTRPPVRVCAADDVALLQYSSRAGQLRGARITHANLTHALAALAPLFPLQEDERVLTVQPLHDGFALSCGLLLPLSRGVRVVLGAPTAALDPALFSARPAAVVCAAREARTFAQALCGPRPGLLGRQLQPAAAKLSERVGRSSGLHVGRLLFGREHRSVGGHLRYLISAQALPQDVLGMLGTRGVRVVSAFALPEVAGVLSLDDFRGYARRGHVGKPIAGLELRVHAPDAEGTGELCVRGPMLMAGYADSQSRPVLDSEGWFHSGVRVRFDRARNLVRVDDGATVGAGEGARHLGATAAPVRPARGVRGKGSNGQRGKNWSRSDEVLGK